jgi:hypothetical protein
MSKRIKIWVAVVACLIVGSCVVWQMQNAEVSRSDAERKITGVLKSWCSLKLTNSWRTVNASGGLVGSPFYSIRWWREYYLQAEGDLAALEAVASELGGRHSSVDVHFLTFPPDYSADVMPHRESSRLAPWWQPESNTVPMHMYADFEGNPTVLIYGYKRTTNAVLYVQIFEGR